MGYGFDLWEWAGEKQVGQWHRYLHERFFQPHLLGARSSKNKLDQISEDMDYSGYEQHKPDYRMYLKTLTKHPDLRSMSGTLRAVAVNTKAAYREVAFDVQREKHVVSLPQESDWVIAVGDFTRD